MESWIGHMIANWPVWVVILLIIIGVITWFFAYGIDGGWSNTSRYEWPEDKKKRLAKEKARKQKIRDFKKNLKLKKG